jgi:hypothetical protein
MGRPRTLSRVPEIYATGMHGGLTGSEFRLAALSRSVCRACHQMAADLVYAGCLQPPIRAA